jgi:phytoene dehydrogenase-like protein
MNREIDAAAVDVAVIGAGLAGLTTAVLVAKRGLKTAVFEQAHEPGGLARAKVHEGFSFNLGPRALYRAGDARRILRELGVAYRAGQPSGQGVAICQDRSYRLPTTISSLLTTRLLGLQDKWQVAKWMAVLPRLDTARYDAVSVHDWIRQSAFRPRVADFVRCLVRLATYCADTEQLSAGAALAQLQSAISSGVDYIDGGWQTLVDSVREAARSLGVKLHAGAKVEEVVCGDTGVQAIRVASGATIAAKIAVLACSPTTAAHLVGGGPGEHLRSWERQARPVRAAALDVGLRRLPRPKLTFALGIDEPWYFSVHSAVARLAPPPGAVIHVLKYVSSNETLDPRQSEQQLAGVLDRLQPGWRDELVHKQFLPTMVVSNDMPRAAAGGLSGRPGPQIAGINGLYVAGDWVGARGLLADATLASAEQVAEQIAAGMSVRVASKPIIENDRSTVHVT